MDTDYETFGVAVDFGAQWIHGIKKNPIHAIAQSRNIKVEPTRWELSHLPVKVKKHGKSFFFHNAHNTRNTIQHDTT